MVVVVEHKVVGHTPLAEGQIPLAVPDIEEGPPAFAHMMVFLTY